MRYSIVQGPRQSFYNAYSGVMRIFALSLLQDKQPVIFEDGRQVRDFINIYDVVDANLTVLYQNASDFSIFNVGGQKAWTVSQFYDTMQQVLNKRKDPLISGYYRFGDTRHIFSDTGRLSKLGWSPTRDIKTSIIDYWHYIKDRKEGVHSLESADEVMKKKAVIRKVKINEKGLL
jgi:dTDP-L-rhamnose 4-epimerase